MKIVEKRKTVMEDLDKVEPAVQEAQQGDFTSSLTLTLHHLYSGEIDQETELGRNQESEQSAARCENHSGIHLSTDRRRHHGLEVHSKHHDAR